MIDKDLIPYLWNPHQYCIDKGEEIRENQRKSYQETQNKFKKIQEDYEKKLLLRKTKSVMKPTFEKGNRVRIIDDKSEYIGWFGVIIDVESEDDFEYTYIIQFDASYFQGNVEFAKDNTEIFMEDEIEFIDHLTFGSIPEALDFIEDK